MINPKIEQALDFVERSKKRMFLNELEKVSTALCAWASDQLWNNDWSIEDVKIAIRNAAKVCGKDI